MSDDEHGSDMNAYRNGYHDGQEDLKDELRELIDTWRNGTLPREGTFDQAADQLEQTIDD